MPLHPPLIALLGADWDFGPAVTGAAWSRDGATAAFGLADGSVALARAHWPGGPQLRTRTSGGVEVIPPSERRPAVSRVGVHNGACLALAPDPSGAFITGGADGKLMAVGADGKAVVLGALPGRAITSVAASRSGLRAGAAGSRLMLFDPCRHSLDIPGEVGALSFDPSGRSLAVAHAAGLAIISSHGGIRRLPMQEAARALAWRPDAKWLAVASGIGLSTWCASEPTMLEHRADIADIRAMAFTADGRVLAASGGARPFCWRFSESGWNADPFETGVRNRLTSVCALTGHPMRPLLAVGYENGAVMLCQPGVDQSLMVKNHGGGAVTGLAWSADGTRLAFGTAEGTAGLLVIPAGLLRETLSETELAE